MMGGRLIPARRPRSDGAPLSTRRVAQRLHVSEATVKRWSDEGLLLCARTPGGHRKFRPADVASFASRYGITSDTAVRPPAVRQSDALMLMLAGDVERLFSLALAALEGGLPLESLLDEVLTTALVEVGERQACSSIGIADEHAATAATLAVLSRLEPTLGRAQPQGLAVSVCVAGERHDVGARMASLMLASRGFRTLTPGADVPLDALLQLVTARRPQVLALSASAAMAEPTTLLRDLRTLAARVQGMGVRLLVGGTAFRETLELPAGVTRVANMRSLASLFPVRSR